MYPYNTAYTMILVHIITETKEQALEIIDILLEKKLLFNAMLSRKKVFERDSHSSKLNGKIKILVIGKTKSLLFNSINILLVSLYGNIDKMPHIYCLPIVYMNQEQSETLLERTVQV